MLKKHNKLIIGSIFVIGLIIYYFIYKYTSFAIECPFHFITGFYCPGCGITRMLFSLLRLDIYQAFRYNPMVFILLVLYIIYYIIKNILKIKIVIPNYVYYSIIGLLIVYAVLRNIPAFDYLAPTVIK